jgi:hypothetical protein
MARSANDAGLCLPVAFISHGTRLLIIRDEKNKIHCHRSVLKQIHQENVKKKERERKTHLLADGDRAARH